MAKDIDVYAAARTDRPKLKAKHLRQFDAEFRDASGARPDHAVLEIGCGTGIFLRYLKARGYRRVVALDSDAGLAPVLDDLAGYDIHLEEAASFLARQAGQSFDRVVLFDVAEHLELPDLLGLMRSLHGLLAPGGRVVIRSPNCGSPWGMKMHLDTFDHVTPITAGRLRELAVATGYKLVHVAGGHLGSASQRLRERLLGAVLGWWLPYHPDFWQATVIGVLEKVG